MSEKCPYDAVIDLDTARLILLQTDSRLRLDNRCVACRGILQVTALLESHNIELEDEETEFCTFKGCEQPSSRMLGRCIQHLFDKKLQNRLLHTHPKKTSVDMGSLRASFESAVRKRWKSSLEYDVVRSRIFEIQEGNRAGSDLVILDTEYSVASSQLWEFALIEKVSGKVLINACIEHENGLDHNSLYENPYLRTVSLNHGYRVFSPSQSPKIDRLNADEVAYKLQAAGITRDTVILVWHTGRTDLRILRRFLESSGHDVLLPPVENCIPLLHLFRTNLSMASPGPKKFPLSLEVLFPILFPRHDLVGLNHRALEDSLQTRLLSLAFDELCKPVKQRGGKWRPENITHIAQTSLVSWLQKTKCINKGKINNLKR